MLYIQGVNKTYHSKSSSYQALKDINIHVSKGEILGIIGKSGAGKSTFIKCLNLLEKPDNGSITIDGVDITKLSNTELRKERQEIGVIFQHFNLLYSKTVFDNIALPLKLAGKSKAEIKPLVEEMLHLVDLSALADSYPARLSGGQKQRVGIARALVTKPKILLSDEATSALDPQTTSSILDLLLKINKALNITIVLITHEIEVVRRICDKVGVIDKGEIIEYGKTMDVLLAPKTALTKSLVLDEDVQDYLSEIKDFYHYKPTKTRVLTMLTFRGINACRPILARVVKETGVEGITLKAEIGRMKQEPYAKMLIEFRGTPTKLQKTFEVLDKERVLHEVVEFDEDAQDVTN